MLNELGLDPKEIIFVIINFLILVGVLGKFLYKPFLGALDARKKAIQDIYNRAEAVSKRADAKMAKYERRIANAEDEGREIIKESKRQADELAQQIIDEANAKADEIIKRAEAAADIERAKAIDELRNDIADMVILASERVVGREIDKAGHKAIIDEVINNARSA